jgi:hypothetical protein
MVAKTGFQANDTVTDLKLIEKGLSREDLALFVLIDFPIQASFKQPIRFLDTQVPVGIGKSLWVRAL